MERPLKGTFHFNHQGIYVFGHSAPDIRRVSGGRGFCSVCLLFRHSNGNVNRGRILQVFRSIVSQLAKPNEKFMYGAVREGGRARDFEETFDRLDRFKLFLFDTGLLKHMAGVHDGAITNLPLYLARRTRELL